MFKYNIILCVAFVELNLKLFLHYLVMNSPHMGNDLSYRYY